mmetsp:Transcript_99422/g.259202  ORF Transcript_99422/g.259202 Transcript_99422/m.259202 type:complete len:217 (+) Transcript_99422:935-1585(+)
MVAVFSSFIVPKRCIFRGEGGATLERLVALPCCLLLATPGSRSQMVINTLPGAGWKHLNSLCASPLQPIFLQACVSSPSSMLSCVDLWNPSVQAVSRSPYFFASRSRKLVRILSASGSRSLSRMHPFWSLSYFFQSFRMSPTYPSRRSAAQNSLKVSFPLWSLSRHWRQAPTIEPYFRLHSISNSSLVSIANSFVLYLQAFENSSRWAVSQARRIW